MYPRSGYFLVTYNFVVAEILSNKSNKRDNILDTFRTQFPGFVKSLGYNGIGIFPANFYYDEPKLDSPFVNPHDPMHCQPKLLAGNLASHLAGVMAAHPTTNTRPSTGTTTPCPLRIFLCVDLKLERFRHGFNFDFQSQ